MLRVLHSQARGMLRLERRVWSTQVRNCAYATRKRLERLESDANRRAGDPFAQAAFLQELGKTHPSVVIQRVESEQFASNEAVFKEYVKALMATRRLDSISSYDLLKPLRGSQLLATIAQASGNGVDGVSPAVANLNTSEGKPVHVQVVEAGMKTQMWKTIRALAIAFVVVSGIGVLLEDMGASRGITLAKEVQPESGEGKTFDDVKGAVEAKKELQEIVSYLRDPSQFTRLGGRLPKGVLLTGPPGTGKTLLAKAIAGEAGVPFFYGSGSEFEEMYVGVGARRVRALFAAAKKKAPCIIFIDEIDAIGSTRSLKEQQALKMTLNQLLVELDGFKETEGIIIIGATNFPDILDPALVRPGRFDRNVVVPLPDLRERQEILDHYLETVPHETKIDLAAIARGTAGASGADLANLVNIAAIKASTDGHQAVNSAHLDFAKDKILMGAERSSAVIPESVRKVTAYHEGGHALVALHTSGAMPIHKATIIPRGRSLGMVMQLPEEKDTMQQSKKQLLASIDVCMGGFVAEELTFGVDEVTSGASSDIQKATSLARNMVERYGMSSTGMMYVPRDQGGSGQTNVSDDMKKEIDAEVRKLLDASYQRAKKLLNTHRRELERLAKALLEHETLTAEEIKLVIRGKKIPAPTG